MIRQDIGFTKEFSSDKLKLVDHASEELQYKNILRNLSHDLRTPVTVLKSNFQILKELCLYSAENTSQQKALTEYESSVESLVNFLDKLHLVNCSIGETDPTFTWFNVRHFFGTLSAKFSDNNQDFSRINFHWDIKNDLIYSDFKFLQTILLNLISNSLKYSKEKVDILISADFEYASITISDRGIGIPDDEQNLIFKPFYRASNTGKTWGAGLGLSGMLVLAQKLGVKMYLYSRLNEGTVFKLLLANTSKITEDS